MNSIFLTADWRNLLLLNYVVDPNVLQKHIPPGTELDDWNGTTYISLVAFQFLNTKVRGWSIPFHRHFEEINLRFYVRYHAEDGWRRGVVFIKEIVPRIAIASVARWLYNENYVAFPTRSKLIFPYNEHAGSMEYGWKYNEEWLSAGAHFSSESVYPDPDSLEEFITEHYWGYSSQRDGGTMEYQVEHPQWKVWSALDANLSGDMISFYGEEFSEAFSSKPASAFTADGSFVSVYKGQRINK